MINSLINLMECPSVGAEQLEENEYESKLLDKKITLIESIDWDDGEWMREWEETCRAAGAILVCEGVICNESPSHEVVNNFHKLGKSVVSKNTPKC